MEALKGIRDSYGQALVDLAEINDRVVALAADSKFSSKLAVFEKRYPNRFFDVGICEQNMVGLAAGLSLLGKIPFISAISCFISMRAFEMIRTSVVYPKLNVKIGSMSAGFAYPQLGATHTCIEDLSLLRATTNIVVLSPSDNLQAYQATRAMADYEGPVYLRLGRHPVPDIYDSGYRFQIGKADLLEEGTDVAIVATGPVVPFALEAHTLLRKDGINARVINLSTIKPLDRELLLKAARETGCIVTVEEHTVAGGMGSAVAELIIQEYPVRMRLLGIPDETPAVAPRDVLLERYNLNAAGIAEVVKRVLKEKRALREEETNYP
ncbi:MAG TPA: transketolase C-terminal domain-containing protein [Spirochaetia bacterium]|nr:transketolase C-terminal domain-containing protein [Spirochaetia bacterium]